MKAALWRPFSTAVRTGTILSMEDWINIDDYPQLALLAWNRAIRNIEGEEALALYERNWPWIEKERLTSNEVALIERLTKQYGHGVLNV